MINPDQIKNWIQDSLVCEHAEVRGDGQHFEAVIVSQAFSGMSRVQRHQRVYVALGDRMQAEIHALSMQTYTPEEWTRHG